MDVACGAELTGRFFLKGTVIIRRKETKVVKYQADGTRVNRQVIVPVMLHADIIADKFWEENSHVLA